MGSPLLQLNSGQTQLGTHGGTHRSIEALSGGSANGGDRP